MTGEQGNRGPQEEPRLASDLGFELFPSPVLLLYSLLLYFFDQWPKKSGRHDLNMRPLRPERATWPQKAPFSGRFRRVPGIVAPIIRLNGRWSGLLAAIIIELFVRFSIAVGGSICTMQVTIEAKARSVIAALWQLGSPSIGPFLGRTASCWDVEPPRLFPRTSIPGPCYIAPGTPSDSRPTAGLPAAGALGFYGASCLF